MDTYTHFTSKEFALDESFRQWVLYPTPELDAQWQGWLTRHPHKAAILREARLIVLAVRLRNPALSDEEVRERVRRTERHFEDQPVPILSVPRQRWLRVAASFLLLICCGAWLYLRFTKSPEGTAYQQLVSAAGDSLTEKINDSESPLRFRLDDGSWITLQGGSRVSYAPGMAGGQRKVYLTGEAFFEVAKDPARPFLVYANELVTKVLGTSFRVRAYEKSPEVAVEVRTGKVSVFTGADPKVKEKATGRELEGVVLTPNQKIVYLREEVRMFKSLVEKPAALPATAEREEFVFEDTPLSQVFARLEKAYSIDIVYDEELLHDCPLTASLSGASFYDKLSVICKAIEARYEVIDGQVVVQSKGCGK